MWQNPIQTHLTNNKRDAKAAGANPLRCNPTNRQNQHIQLNYCNFWTKNTTRILKILNIVKFMIESTISKHFGKAAPKRHFHKLSLNQSANECGCLQSSPLLALMRYTHIIGLYYSHSKQFTIQINAAYW